LKLGNLNFRRKGTKARWKWGKERFQTTVPSKEGLNSVCGVVLTLQLEFVMRSQELYGISFSFAPQPASLGTQVSQCYATVPLKETQPPCWVNWCPWSSLGELPRPYCCFTIGRIGNYSGILLFIIFYEIREKWRVLRVVDWKKYVPLSTIIALFRVGLLCTCIYYCRTFFFCKFQSLHL
jgi:hypothetical protein